MRAAIIAALVALCGCQQNPAQLQKVAQAKEPPPSNAAPDWQRIKDCSQQAEHEFLAEGYRRNDPKSLNGFVNHYDPATGRCFILITSMQMIDGRSWDMRSLYDAFEGKQFAEYSFQADKVKKYWEVPPVSCWVLSAAGEKPRCKSGEEFDEAVKLYMGKP